MIFNRGIRSTLWAAMCLAALLCGSCRDEAVPSRLEYQARVEINGATWRVECATTKIARYIGMGGRRELAQDAGMLFIYPSAQVLDFCMRDCEIPLDIAFIGSDMKVVAIHTMQVEADRAGRKPYSSFAPAQYALEVPAGALGQAAVQVGQTATFTGNIPAATKADP